MRTELQAKRIAPGDRRRQTDRDPGRYLETDRLNRAVDRRQASSCRNCRGREAWIVVRDVSKWRLSAKLQVECAIFDVVENSEAASHYELATAQRVPGETKSRSEIVAVGINQPTIGCSRIAGVQEVGRSCRENGGLLSRIPAHNLVMRIFLG